MQAEAGAPLTAQPDPPLARFPNAPPRRRRLFVLLTGVAVLSYVVDQASKAWAVAQLSGEAPRDLLGTFLRLDLIRNAGAAFSLGNGNTWVLTVIAVVVLGVVILTSRRLGSVGWAWAFGLLLGGALGNLTDRIVRAPGPGRGHVVDFLDYNGWFIGNAADIAIVSAALLIAVLAARGIGVDGTRERRQPEGKHAARADSADTGLPKAPDA